MEVNGQTVDVPEGSTIMDAARKLGIFVPHFCYHKKLSIAANCRMCLVDVEKAPKPLPACATPVSTGMKVMTHSARAVDAQKSVMEFLLINHPLDCPICDQGGECQLQDLAVGYGSSQSVYSEEKRVVSNKNLGSLISTEMTRCIHCTRCVRFGEEVAGLRELGVIGRGEHAEITTFLSRAVSSEISGNVIDLCPVGALTSKPFRYSNRTWELSRRRSFSPHDSLGSNLIVQVKLKKVCRVLPLENEKINQCWISDRDRFSYLGIGADRLQMPRIKSDDEWKTISWDEAFDQLSLVLSLYCPDDMAGWAHPSSTLEELYLFQKLLRSLGVKNVESRLNYGDYRKSFKESSAPYLGMTISELLSAPNVFIIGSFIRHEQPLLAAGLRVNVRNSLTTVHRLHVTKEDWLMPLGIDIIVSPDEISLALVSILSFIVRDKGCDFPTELQNLFDKTDSRYDSVARKMLDTSSLSIVLGSYIDSHPDSALIHCLVSHIARYLGATFGLFGEGANYVGAYVSGAISHSSPLLKNHRLLMLLNVEPNEDFTEKSGFGRYFDKAEYVVCFSPFESAGVSANLHLPIASAYETDGTYINMEGVWNSFYAAAQPSGEVKPAWKILRQLGYRLCGDGFSYASCTEIRQEVMDLWNSKGGEMSNDLLQTSSFTDFFKFPVDSNGLKCIAYRHAYRIDSVVRRSDPLQKSPMMWTNVTARVSPQTAQRFSMTNSSLFRFRQGDYYFEAKIYVDCGVLDDTVLIEDIGLSSLYETVYVEENLCS
ncbi:MULTISPECIES: NADH-quinone oxidoreductase subunit NuoG [Candidatus Ichthyocystis]|nr:MULTISPECIES: NADH-quinone oxidoreductase subunit NuoG [Ichthyocystis]